MRQALTENSDLVYQFIYIFFLDKIDVIIVLFSLSSISVDKNFDDHLFR